MLGTAQRELGHRESVFDLPRPTDRPGLWGLGGIGLPAVVVSWSSLAVTVVTFLALQATPDLRAVFQLPLPPAVVSLAAAVVTAFVAHRCRERPGRRFPRFWSLGLLAVTVLAAGLGGLDPMPGGTPWRHAAGLALLAGALALAPRLLSVRPDRRWAELMGPLAVAAAIAVLVPMLLAGRWAFARRLDNVAETMARLEAATETVNRAAANDWTILGTDSAGAEAALAPLAALDPETLRVESGLWRTAVVTGLDRELAAASSELAAAAVEALAPATVPRVSVLEEPAVRWDQRREEWTSNGGFQRASRVVGGYHRRLGELFAALDPVGIGGDGIDLESPALREYRSVYQESRGSLHDHVEAAARAWSDRWAVERIPAARGVPGAVDPPLADVLRGSLGHDAADDLAPAELWKLMETPLSRARDLAAETPGCFLRTYGEGEHDFARLDCYAYRPRSEEGADGAELRVEMRLVWVAPSGTIGWRGGDRPTEVYFLFPVPSGTGNEAHLQAVAEAMARAVADRWPGGFRLLDRSGSALHGFILEREGRSLIVYRPRLESFVGERRVVAVRGEWRRR